VHPADIQDRDGGVLVLSTLFGLYPFLQKLFADGGYQGPVFQKASAKILPHLQIEIVKRSDQAKGFELLPRRWLSNALSLGLIAAAGWPRISKISPETARFSPPRLDSSHAQKALSELMNFRTDPEIVCRSPVNSYYSWSRTVLASIKSGVSSPSVPL